MKKYETPKITADVIGTMDIITVSIGASNGDDWLVDDFAPKA